MRASSLCLLFFLAGCGRVDGGPSSSGGPPSTKPPTDPTTTEPTKPAKGSMGVGDVSFYSVEGDGLAFAHFVPGPAPMRKPSVAGCTVFRDGAGASTPAEVSAGRVTISGTADGKKFSFPIDWDARKREYQSTPSTNALPASGLGTLRFEAAGGEVPPFDILLEPLPPLKIVTPAMDSVLDGGDLSVTWDTLGRGTALVNLVVGGDVSVDCLLPGSERSVTIPSALVREALEGRRAAGQPAVCEKTSCATLIVGMFTGTTVDVEGWDIDVSHAQLAGVGMDIVPK